ncbi:hypothetical protein JYU34_004508 [Plutella xylostella]|uniref:Uncharacterized protein n=1 Tax=Plutella xylostella TaxID=51655 RepID=A0ABQ7QY61_PLUXY|nr:hypothetical protein JYU34_004508 [Plutella xylostella]
MFQFYKCTSIMQRNVAVFIIAFLLLCLSCNYTFPLHRDLKNFIGGKEENTSIIPCSQDPLVNEAQSSESKQNHADSKTCTLNHTFSEDDLRHYEQKVIMKKYPYLDMKEFEQLRPPLKVVRQNAKFAQDEEPLCPPEHSLCNGIVVEEGPDVEIINRGLSGFFLPAVSKITVLKDETPRSDDILIPRVPLSDPALESLHNDVVEFYKQLNSVNKD